MEPTTGAETSPSPSAAAITVVENGLDAATTDALNAAGAAAFAEISAPGAIMAVRTSNGTWVGTIGAQDLAGSRPVSADLHQRIGSITKTFTVTALLQLAEKGLLSLDDPISKYIAGMPNPEATLGQLAAMRSGIPAYTAEDAYQKRLFTNPTGSWSPEEMVALVKGHAPDFAPGTRTSYSNTNLVLLGMVIEQVTGKTLSEVIQQQVIEPLGLKGTVFPTDASFPEPHGHGYTVQGQDNGVPADATDWSPSSAWAAGAMISTLDDLLVYGRELVAGGKLLAPELQAQRIGSFDFDIPPNSPARAYGLGLALANGWYGHTGELPGFNTVLQHHLDQDTTLVVMANSDIMAGDCPAGAPIVPDGPKEGPCDNPAVHLANALAAALGSPLVLPKPASGG